MSTKPSFDDVYEDDSNSSEEYELKLIKQSSSLDNYSKYDNYFEYGSNNADDSLLDLINEEGDDDAPATMKHDKLESMMKLLREDRGEIRHIENITQSSQGEIEEESLLQLLQVVDEGSLIRDLNSTSDHYTDEEETLSDLLNDETKNDAQSSKYQDLQRLQLKLEIESAEEAFSEHLLELKSARDRSDHATIPGVRRALNSWYEQLTDAIELEQWLYLNGDYKTSTSRHVIDGESDDDTKTKTVKDRTIYGPLLCLLPARKIAVLLAHTALSCTVANGETGSKVVALALNIAQALETEVNVSRVLRARARERAECKCGNY
jgi:hypothetical protein